MSSDETVVPASTFAAKLAAAQARHGIATSAMPEPQPKAGPTVPEDHIPDIEVNRDPDQEALDLAIKNMTILDAYAKWCGKMIPKTGGKREGIMVSCPNPAHPDTNPSAWVNLDKNLYTCPGCNYGGDVWDIAAFGLGFPVPGYKNDPALFRQLRETIGLDLGFNIVRGATQTYLIPPNEPQQLPIPEPQQEEKTENNVALLPSGAEHEAQEEEFAANRNGPAIPWREIIPENTFLRDWLDATTVDDCPEEFHVWTGLMAIGFAIGKSKTLWDLRPVVGNIYTCLVGPSGSGKSRAKEHLATILNRVMPWDGSTYSGVKTIKAPGSAEYLVQAFSATEEDPSSPGAQIFHSVRGNVDFEELSSLVGIGGRMGSVLKPQLMDIYDARAEISSGSLTHGLRLAKDPYGQCTSTTQTESLRKLLDKGDEASGFLNRWIFASGVLKPARALGGQMVELDVPATSLNSIYMWSQRPSLIAWTEDAVNLWTEFFNGTLNPAKDMAEHNGSAMLNRIDLTMKKLILLMTANVMADIVPRAAVEQAIALYPYLLETYGVVNRQIERTEGRDQTDKILEAVKRLFDRNKKEPTRRDIYQSVRKSFSTTKQLDDLLKSLVSLEILEEVVPVRKPGQRGQLGVRYRVASD